jgi:hypothetical protein
MFHLVLVVTVVGDVVTFAVRTEAARVDEYTFSVEEFREVIANAAVKPNKTMHIYIRVSENKREIYAVSTADFGVMVAQFEAQVGG